MWMVLLPPAIIGITMGLLLILAAYEAWCFRPAEPARVKTASGAATGRRS